MAFSLASCGGTNAEHSFQGTCASLSGVMVKAEEISLPTRGAEITSALDVEKTQAGVPSHCMVSGRIKSVEPLLPDIRFNLALPNRWNEKAAMLGGAGFDGVIPNVTGNMSNTLVSAPSPLARGYAVFGNDSGHQSTAPNPVIDASALIDPEVEKNWYGDAIKKTRDVADILIRTHYGRPQILSYFLGSSTGGRGALTAISRWPLDWDGAVALYPARPTRAMNNAMLVNSRALAAPGSFPSVANRALLHTAALEACDLLDGAKDGIISNTAACNSSFDPFSAKLKGKSIRCDVGSDGDSCISFAQLYALRVINSPLHFGYPLDSGETEFPGYNAYISDLGSSLDSPMNRNIVALSLGFSAPGYPATPDMSYQVHFADQGTRFLLTKNQNFNFLSIDPLAPGEYLTAIKKTSLDDVTSSVHQDLSLFSSRGGKLILLHGTEDMLISPRSSEKYLENLNRTMGEKSVADFLRYYEVAGFAHGVGKFSLVWDPITALEKWKEANIDPGNRQIITDSAGVPGRTRPLCEYPSWPKYVGNGSLNDAASFDCSTS